MSKTIYMVLYTLSIGGAERHASFIANYLSQHGYRVKIVLLQNNIVDYTLRDGIEVTALTDFEYSDSIVDIKTSFVNKVFLKIYGIVSEKKYNLLVKKIFIESLYLKKLESFFKQQNDVDPVSLPAFTEF